MAKGLPVLYLVVPCYNEQEVLPITAPEFSREIKRLSGCGLISESSRILFVDDGSRDGTWQTIRNLCVNDPTFIGIKQSRNRGHQSALLAGLMEVKDRCDITVSIDCDGQDDISALEEMVKAYYAGNDVVYGVRDQRNVDSAFKRTTARGFYKFLNLMGAEVVYDHADYRLISSRVLSELAKFGEVNLFLRGMIPLVGFSSTSVFYTRKKREAGKTHYTVGKMAALALDGITSLSVRPLRLISFVGAVVSGISFIGILWALISWLCGSTVTGWVSTVCIICFIGGIQLLSLGVIGEYIGKIYLEVKHRPRYIISERTEDEKL